MIAMAFEVEMIVCTVSSGLLDVRRFSNPLHPGNDNDGVNFLTQNMDAAFENLESDDDFPSGLITLY